MPEYTRTTWANEVPSVTPVKYKISQSSDGDIATNAEIELVTPVTAGTPINAANLNKIEQGLVDAFAALKAYPAKAYNSGTQAISTPVTDTIVQFNTELFDPDNCFLSTTYIAAADGYYHVNFRATVLSALWGLGDYVHARLYKNGVSYSRFVNWNCPADGTYPVPLDGTDMIDLEAGDSLTIRVRYERAGGAITLDTIPVFSIFRLVE